MGTSGKTACVQDRRANKNLWCHKKGLTEKWWHHEHIGCRQETLLSCLR